MAIFDKKYLEEAYNSKYSKYLKNDDDDDDEDDDKEEDDNKSEIQHLSQMELRRISTMIMSKLQDYPKLKKCCDYISLSDKDHINDDGKRASAFDDYYDDEPTAFIKLVDGDVFSGYPDFRNGGNANYEKDEKAFVKDMNEFLKQRNISAKFMVGKDRDDEAISFGVKSTKKK